MIFFYFFLVICNFYACFLRRIWYSIGVLALILHVSCIIQGWWTLNGLPKLNQVIKYHFDDPLALHVQFGVGTYTGSPLLFAWELVLTTHKSRYFLLISAISWSLRTHTPRYHHCTYQHQNRYLDTPIVTDDIFLLFFVICKLYACFLRRVWYSIGVIALIFYV